MSPEITITIVEGEPHGKTVAFHDRTLCTVGRGSDCFLHFPSHPGYLDISRHHCVFDIDPPHVRVRDLGSRNGTFVNGTRIGQRLTVEETGQPEQPAYELEDGDEIRLGHTLLRVRVSNPVFCCKCSDEILPDQQAGAEKVSGVFYCADCWDRAERERAGGMPEELELVGLSFGRSESWE